MARRCCESGKKKQINAVQCAARDNFSKSIGVSWLNKLGQKNDLLHFCTFKNHIEGKVEKTRESFQEVQQKTEVDVANNRGFTSEG